MFIVHVYMCSHVVCIVVWALDDKILPQLPSKQITKTVTLKVTMQLNIMWN